MQVSVEPVNGLMRKMTIVLPGEKIDEQFSLRIKKLAQTAQIKGFRPGHVPLHEVERRYGNEVRDEVARELMQSTMFDAFAEKEIVPVNRPSVESYEAPKGQDFKFTILFEVYPEIKLQEFSENTPIELISAKITDADVEKVIDELKRTHRTWKEVNRSIEANDRLHVDIEILHNDAPLSPEPLKDHIIVLDEPTFNPVFKEKLLGAKLGDLVTVITKFDENVEDKSLVGKEGTFKITVNKIEEPILPEVDEAFAVTCGISKGGVEALRKDIRSHIEWQLEQEISSRNKKSVFDKYLEINPLELPLSLVDAEIENMRHDFYHRVSGEKHTHNEKIPEFPREWFEVEAKRRVHLGLVLSEYIKMHQLTVDTTHVDAMIEKMTSRFEDSTAAKAAYTHDKKQMQALEMLAMENLVCERLQDALEVTQKNSSYQEIFEKNKTANISAE